MRSDAPSSGADLRRGVAADARPGRRRVRLPGGRESDVARRRWRLIGRQIDTVIFHLPRWDAEGVEHPAIGAVRSWVPAGLAPGRAGELADGVRIEIDTQHAAGAIRVTLGPAWLWPHGGLDLVALGGLLGSLAGATIYRVDVAADFQAPDQAALDAEISALYARALSLETGPIPKAWGRPGGLRGYTVAVGERGSAVQIRAYDKAAKKWWRVLGRYAATWQKAGWPGIICQICGSGGELGERCCGAKRRPWPVLRLEVEWPRRYLEETTLGDVEEAVGWLCDLGGQGRAPTLRPELVPDHLRSRVLAAGRAVSRPRQTRKTRATAEGQITHWTRIADSAARIAEEIAEAEGGGAALLHRAILGARERDRQARETRRKVAASSSSSAPASSSPPASSSASTRSSSSSAAPARRPRAAAPRRRRGR